MASGGRVAASSDETSLERTDETHLAAPRRVATPRTPAHKPSSSGWLSSSGSIDHGRFAPGTVLDGRYRVIGLLGRGGMGEVYRADDLRLGQPVALKFLPEDLARDPVRLAQFHNEVRTARQVSHPNVCRVYDIGEIEGASVPLDGVRRRRGSRRVAASASAGFPRTRRSRSRGRSAPGSPPRTNAACSIAI